MNRDFFLLLTLFFVSADDQFTCLPDTVIPESTKILHDFPNEFCHTVLSTEVEGKHIRVFLGNYNFKGTTLVFDGTDCLAPRYFGRNTTIFGISTGQNLTLLSLTEPNRDQTYAFKLAATVNTTGDGQEYEFLPNNCIEDLSTKPDVWITRNGTVDLCLWIIKKRDGPPVYIKFKRSNKVDGYPRLLYVFYGLNCNTSHYEVKGSGERTVFSNSPTTLILYRSMSPDSSLEFGYSYDKNGPTTSTSSPIPDTSTATTSVTSSDSTTDTSTATTSAPSDKTTPGAASKLIGELAIWTVVALVHLHAMIMA